MFASSKTLARVALALRRPVIGARPGASGGAVFGFRRQLSRRRRSDRFGWPQGAADLPLHGNCRRRRGVAEPEHRLRQRFLSARYSRPCGRGRRQRKRRMAGIHARRQRVFIGARQRWPLHRQRFRRKFQRSCLIARERAAPELRPQAARGRCRARRRQPVEISFRWKTTNCGFDFCGLGRRICGMNGVRRSMTKFWRRLRKRLRNSLRFANRPGREASSPSHRGSTRFAALKTCASSTDPR